MMHTNQCEAYKISNTNYKQIDLNLKYNKS